MLKQACDHFTQAIELDPDYLKPVYQRMCLYKQNTDYEDAIKDAKRVQELDHNFPKISAEIVELEKL